MRKVTCIYSYILTYEFCPECQHKVKNQSDVWQECFYLMKGNLEVHLDKKYHDVHAIAQFAEHHSSDKIVK